MLTFFNDTFSGAAYVLVQRHKQTLRDASFADWLTGGDGFVTLKYEPSGKRVQPGH